MNCLIALTISTILSGICLDTARGNPVPAPLSEENDSTLSVPASVSDELPAPTQNAAADGSKSKPRCLQTLLGYYAKDKVMGAMDGYMNPDAGIPSLPSPPGSLQGGMLSGPSYDAPGVGAGGLPSHAMDAVNKAQLMNSQLGSMNSQLNSQFGGPTGPSGPSIPFSPIQFRHGMNGFSTGIYENSGFPYASPQGYLQFM